jgi:HEPN domain-containing protein
MEPIDIQISRWIEQAEHDLDVAQKLTGLDAFDHASFLAQQSAEKYLKALWMKKHNQAPPRTHDLVRLAIELNASSEIIEAARMMSGDYMATRYPDIGEIIPAEEYSDMDAQERMEAARKVQHWVKENL